MSTTEQEQSDMTPGTVNTTELKAIVKVFDAQGGYVLDFTDRSFAEFFMDLGVEIYGEYRDASKGKTLRRFCRGAPPILVAQALQALLDYRGTRVGDDSSSEVAVVKQVIARLQKAQPIVEIPLASMRHLELQRAREIAAKLEKRLAEGDFDGAIGLARTTLEEVLVALEAALGIPRNAESAQFAKQFKQVVKCLGFDCQRPDLDEPFRQVVRGLVQVIEGLAPIRNKMSDVHAIERQPAPHHARVVSNAAKTIALFLVESYHFQRERGALCAEPHQSRAADRGRENV